MPPTAFARPLALATALGLLAELLFDGSALGVGVPVFVVALLGAAWVVRPADARVDPADLWLAPTAVLFAAFVAIRSDPTLVRFDVVVAVGLSVGAAVALSGAPVTRRALEPLVRLTGWATAVVFVGFAHLIAGARPWAHLGKAGAASARTGRVARGLLLAALPVAAFVGLFAAADAVFARAVTDVTSAALDLGDTPRRLGFVLVGVWLASGCLAIVVFGTDPASRRGASLAPWTSVFFGSPGASGAPAAVPADRESIAGWGTPDRLGWRRSELRPHVGSLEATVVLLAIDLVFAAFVVIQVAYLFGGLDTLAASGVTYSDYATRGFRELVAVAVLAGLVILSLEATIERRTRAYLIAAGALLGLTAVVLGSAFLRLRLYQDAYGWTELRFYVLTAIVYLALAIGLIGALLARDRSRWAVHGLAILMLIVAVDVNLVGPMSFIAGQNVARAIDPSLVPPSGKSGLDAAYVLQLGDDAIPTLVSALPRLPDADRQAIVSGLRIRAGQLQTDPRLRGPAAWNLARTQAREALEAGLPR